MTIPQNIKAVIFDVDGVIIDSEPAWQKSHNEFIDRHNLSVNEYYKASFRGRGLKQIIVQLREKFHLEQSVEELIEEYREIFYKNFFALGTETIIAGVEELIRAFYAKGYPMAIATGGHTKEKMSMILETFNLLKYFPIVASSDEVHRGKPHPDVFLYTAEKLGVEPERCLVIEDSVNGVQAGKAAGMYVIGINYEEKIYNQLKTEGADEIFHNPSEVLKQI